MVLDVFISSGDTGQGPGVPVSSCSGLGGAMGFRSPIIFLVFPFIGEKGFACSNATLLVYPSELETGPSEK